MLSPAQPLLSLFLLAPQKTFSFSWPDSNACLFWPIKWWCVCLEVTNKHSQFVKKEIFEKKKKWWPFVFKRFKLWGRSKRKIELSKSLMISPLCKQNLWIKNLVSSLKNCGFFKCKFLWPARNWTDMSMGIYSF